MALIAIALLAIVAVSATLVVAGTSRQATAAITTGAQQWALADMRARLAAATMYDPSANAALASDTNATFTLVEPTPASGSRYPADPGNVAFTVTAASTKSLTLQYGSVTGIITYQQRAPSCNAVLTSIGACTAH